MHLEVLDLHDMEDVEDGLLMMKLVVEGAVKVGKGWALMGGGSTSGLRLIFTVHLLRHKDNSKKIIIEL